MGLGGVIAVPLTKARELAAGCRAQVAAGFNPIAARRAAKAEIPTFGAFADAFVATKEVEWRNAKHQYQWRMTLAHDTGAAACRQASSDVWESAFDLARKNRSGTTDVVPYWVFPGDAKIERHVPALPYSREVERLHDLCRALAIYRMVFGQSRQEDLIQYILATVPEEQQLRITDQLKIDLGPTSLPQRHDRLEVEWPKPSSGSGDLANLGSGQPVVPQKEAPVEPGYDA
jgi:hypothetical protein